MNPESAACCCIFGVQKEYGICLFLIVLSSVCLHKFIVASNLSTNSSYVRNITFKPSFFAYLIIYQLTTLWIGIRSNMSCCWSFPDISSIVLDMLVICIDMDDSKVHLEHSKDLMDLSAKYKVNAACLSTNFMLNTLRNISFILAKVPNVSGVWMVLHEPCMLCYLALKPIEEYLLPGWMTLKIWLCCTNHSNYHL